MDIRTRLLTEADQYCSARGISRARLATLVVNDGKFFDRVEKGGDFTVRTFERFMQYFADNPVPAHQGASGEAA